MRRSGIIGMAFVLGLPALGAADFSRYALILERRPFSSPVVEEPAAPPPVTAVAPPDFVQDLRMVAITESPAGIRVGFVNIRQRPPKVYYLYVGESEDGILLADADFDAERALVRKDGEQFWMTMGAGGGTSEPPPPPPAVASPRGRPAPPPPPASSPPQVVASGAAADGPGGGSDAAASYAERRRQRLEEMRRRSQESRRLSEEEMERRLQEYQMQLIRAGRTPLPIPITEEMDAQLVKEGILPPVE